MLARLLRFAMLFIPLAGGLATMFSFLIFNFSLSALLRDTLTALLSDTLFRVELLRETLLSEGLLSDGLLSDTWLSGVLLSETLISDGLLRAALPTLGSVLQILVRSASFGLETVEGVCLLESAPFDTTSACWDICLDTASWASCPGAC